MPSDKGSEKKQALRPEAAEAPPSVPEERPRGGTGRNAVEIGIGNIHEVKTVGRRRGAGETAIPPFKNLPHPGYRLISETDFQKGARDISDHVKEKGIGGDVQGDKIPLPGY
jgi:hypothetical protein